jgi:hypothetical protein
MSDMKSWFELGSTISAILGGGVIGWYGMIRPIVQKIQQEWSKSKQQKEMHLDRNIQELLSELRHDADSCRTKLFQYHNGSSFANGNSMKKMSMTHESCHPGMVPTFKGNTDQMLSLFVDMLEILENDKSTLIVVSNMKDSYFKSYLQSNHVLMISLLPIRNTRGGQVGCILCEWCGWSFADKVEETKFEDKFVKIRNSIQYLLSTTKKRGG